jgi:hypothetical protein
LKELPYTISIPEWNTTIVHAGLVPHVPFHEQKIEDMTRMRNLILSNEEVCGFVGSENKDEGVPWASEWKSLPHIYFGHDAKRSLQTHEFATGLDTGCCYGQFNKNYAFTYLFIGHMLMCALGKRLTAVLLPDKVLIDVPARAVYEKQKD